jgi:hypothetical protein
MEREWSAGGARVERELMFFFSKVRTFTVHDLLA